MNPSQGYTILQRIWRRSRVALIGLGLLAICLIFVESKQMPLSSLVRLHPDAVTLSFVVPNDEAPQWQSLAAVRFLRQTMFDEQPISPKALTTQREDETLKFFLEGNAAFLRNWSYVLPRANLTDSAIRNTIGVKPMIHASGRSGAGCQGGWGLG